MNCDVANLFHEKTYSFQFMRNYITSTHLLAEILFANSTRLHGKYSVVCCDAVLLLLAFDKTELNSTRTHAQREQIAETTSNVNSERDSESKR